MATGYSSPTSSERGEESSLICKVCCEVFTSPRLLPCHHTCCLSCLEGLVASHGLSFPCPLCGERIGVPDGGVSAFQVNFYITERELELARKPGPRMCPTHEDERLRFLCLQCDTVICRDCKLTKHDGHSSEDLFEAAARCKASLETAQSRLEECIRVVEDKLKEAQEDQAAAQEKREVIEKEIELRYTALVASAKKWRDRVKEELKTECEKTDKELAKTTQKVQKELDTLLDLHQRAQNAQEGHPADVVEIEREMEVSSRSEEELAKVQESLPTSTLRLKLECDVTSLCDDDIRRYMGSVATDVLHKRREEEIVLLSNVNKEVERCLEVHAICQGRREEDSTDCACNYALDDRDETQRFWQVMDNKTSELGVLKCCKSTLKLFHGKHFATVWTKHYRLFSKSQTPFQIGLTSTKECFVSNVTMDKSAIDFEETTLFTVNIPMPAAFDATRRGFLFVMLNDQKEEREAREDDKPVLCAGPRGGIVRIFYYGHSDSIATYTPPQPTSLLTDVCFCHVHGQEKLLVSDWMNDAIHVVSVPKAWMEEGLKLSDVKDADLKFERYLASGSGKIVRPTALNTDTDGNVLIGCGNGWVLRCIMG
ncbi:hypothetical protein BaRGS_00023554 [Batillaria attramentaria]|uniref:Uncharacterized protein n=1 Tax=Batillaria attramentaria TaxID=370345 RepID=A0ABD0KDG5_9CAEN